MRRVDLRSASARQECQRTIDLIGPTGGDQHRSRAIDRPRHGPPLPVVRLSRNIHHLTSLLREGNVRPALVYRDMLDTLAGDVRRHLTLAAGVLADLRPRSRSSDASTHPTT